jgi:hypothetical protein
MLCHVRLITYKFSLLLTKNFTPFTPLLKRGYPEPIPCRGNRTLRERRAPAPMGKPYAG